MWEVSVVYTSDLTDDDNVMNQNRKLCVRGSSLPLPSALSIQPRMVSNFLVPISIADNEISQKQKFICIGQNIRLNHSLFFYL